MPIRFRCVYCNQLMGIARRKAGTVVRCPSCASQVTVPNLSAEGPSEQPARAPASSEPAPPLFERSDFDELFNPGGVHTRPAAAPAPPYDPPAPLPSPGPAAFLKEPAPPAFAPDPGTATALAPDTAAPSKPGIWLTPGMLTWLSVGLIVALVLMFVLGFLLGSKLQTSHPDDRARANAVSVQGGCQSNPLLHSARQFGRLREELRFLAGQNALRCRSGSGLEMQLARGNEMETHFRESEMKWKCNGNEMEMHFLESNTLSSPSRSGRPRHRAPPEGARGWGAFRGQPATCSRSWVFPRQQNSAGRTALPSRSTCASSLVGE